MGSMSGRRVGYCAGYDAPGFANPVRGGRRFGRWNPGRGFGRGWGRGWRHRAFATGRPGWVDYGPSAWGYAPPPTPEQELNGLKSEADWLKSQLDAISPRIEELEK
jgi:hypothetical protein